MKAVFTTALFVCAIGAFGSSAAAATLTVAAGGDLQAALNAAQPGDTILLQAGATFVGPFDLPAKGGSSYITIRSSTADASLPPAGTRITPAAAALLPKIVSTIDSPAMRAAPGATYWRIMFVEFAPSVANGSADLLEFGPLDPSQSTLASVPQHLAIDRCYFHGNPTYGQRRGLMLNSADTQILNSYFSDFKLAGTDTQAIAGANGPGPYLIDNNYLEAAGENLMFGGSDPYIPNLIPSNITVTHNLFSKPVAWMTQSWTIKNLLELKNAQHVLIEGNTFENVWAAAQDGYAFQLTVRNQENTAPWSIVADVTIQNNIIRHAAAIANILGYDDVNPSQQTQNIVIRNNLMYDITTAWTAPGHEAAPGRLAQIGAAPKNITIDHNTVDSNGPITVALYAGITPTGSYTITGFQLTNNLMRDNAYGIFGDNSSPGLPSLAMYTSNPVVLRNTLAGGPASSYPTGNFFPTLTDWLASFAAPASGDYTLTSAAPWHLAGTDGKDLGVDFGELNAALNGTTPAPPPPSPAPPPPTAPPPTAPAGPTPFTGTPIALPGRIEAENYDKGGEGVAYHDTTVGNSGGAYRTDDVDIKVTSDASGAYNVKAVRAGEWLAYTVNVTNAGTYTIRFRIASSGGGGTIHLTLDGTDITGPIVLPDTGGWSVWKTVSKTGIALPAGTHVLKLVVDANGAGGTAADINFINVVSSATAPASGSTPYSGTPVALPGTIQMENYDKGGEGVAYHDTTPGNNSGVYRNDDVDLQVTTDVGGGYKVKTAVATEWLNYTVSVATAGTFTLSMRASADGAGGTFHVEANGVDVTGPIAVPNTGGWDAWVTVQKTGVALAAGTQVLRVVMDSNGASGLTGNFNWLQVN